MDTYSFEGRKIVVSKALKSKLGDRFFDKESEEHEKATQMMSYRGEYFPIFSDDNCFYTYMPDGELFNTFNFTPIDDAVQEFAYRYDIYLKENRAELRRLTRKCYKGEKTFNASTRYNVKFDVCDDSASMRSGMIIDKLGKLEDFEYDCRTDLIKILQMIAKGDMYYLSSNGKEILYTNRFNIGVYGHIRTEKPTFLKTSKEGKGVYFLDLVKEEAGVTKRSNKFEKLDFMLSDYGEKFALTKEELKGE